MSTAQDLIIQVGQDQLAQAEAENARLRESLAYKMGVVDTLQKMADLINEMAPQETPSCRPTSTSK